MSTRATRRGGVRHKGHQNFAAPPAPWEVSGTLGGMALIGYARVSTVEQDPSTQVEQLRAAGCERVFVEHGKSSRRRDRPQWIACMDYMRRGDGLVVYRLDRLAGTTSLMLDTIEQLRSEGIDLRSLTEPEFDTTTPMGRAAFGMSTVFAQLRVDTIRQNTVDGLARARAEVRVGGRPTVITPERITAARSLRDQGSSYRAIAAAIGVSATTVRRMLTVPEQVE